MPCFQVFLDGNEIARVRTDGYDVLSIRVGGIRIDEEFASIDMTAGAYPENGVSSHLIWLNCFPLTSGQHVKVELSEEGETSRPGQTIEELYPDEGSNEPSDFRPTSEIIAELRGRPSLRDGYAFELRSPKGTCYRGRSTDDEYGFGFTVLWNSHRPERASVSLHTYTIDSVEKRAPGRDHVREYLETNQSVAFTVDA